MYVWCVLWLDGLMLGGGLVVCVAVLARESPS